VKTFSIIDNGELSELRCIVGAHLFKLPGCKKFRSSACCGEGFALKINSRESARQQKRRRSCYDLDLNAGVKQKSFTVEVENSERGFASL